MGWVPYFLKKNTVFLMSLFPGAASCLFYNLNACRVWDRLESNFRSRRPVYIWRNVFAALEYFANGRNQIDYRSPLQNEAFNSCCHRIVYHWFFIMVEALGLRRPLPGGAVMLPEGPSGRCQPRAYATEKKNFSKPTWAIQGRLLPLPLLYGF